MKVFQTLSELPDGHKQILMDTISVRREDVRQALMSETNTISEAVLTDFDWQVKVSRLANKNCKVVGRLWFVVNLVILNLDNWKVMCSHFSIVVPGCSPPLLESHHFCNEFLLTGIITI